MLDNLVQRCAGIVRARLRDATCEENAAGVATFR